ncbi:pyridoxine/pyridoxamine 5'-phosphate oxidase-like isoform X1 [Diabrotica undecimpunctata]|uniref:pyridoxine/pyridoxamine 5'-phosphate oxidase-like isoform X1 n=2 Tax=Diabrotica undecimpunctata TaxID=50387 RepID=UPI003B6336B8
MANSHEMGLACMEVPPNTSPFKIMREWIDEAKHCGMLKPVFNIATATKTGEVLNRTITYAEITEEEDFFFVTDVRSTKSKHIAENPTASVCLLLYYLKDGITISRQVRFFGPVGQLPTDQTSAYFDHIPEFMKVKFHIVQQGKLLDWETHKNKFDSLRQQCEKGLELKMPSTVIAYRLTPVEMDFYNGRDHCIADRIIFKSCGNGKWCHRRIGP